MTAQEIAQYFDEVPPSVEGVEPKAIKPDPLPPTNESIGEPQLTADWRDLHGGSSADTNKD